jgi:uncharacterized membrane protein YciS (DUF1049 family)
MEARAAAIPMFSAVASMALIVLLNIVTVLVVIAAVTGHSISHLVTTRTETFSLMVLFGVLFYRGVDAAWIKDGKLLYLRKEFSDVLPARQLRNRVIFWVYAFASLMALPLTGLLVHAVR